MGRTDQSLKVRGLYTLLSKEDTIGGLDTIKQCRRARLFMPETMSLHPTSTLFIDFHTFTKGVEGTRESLSERVKRVIPIRLLTGLDKEKRS